MLIDADLPLNYPRCGVPLIYVVTDNDGSHVYVCDVHGEHRLSQDGFLRGGTGAYGRLTNAATDS